MFNRRNAAITTFIALLIAITTLTAPASTTGTQFAFLDQVKEYFGGGLRSSIDSTPVATPTVVFSPAATIASEGFENALTLFSETSGTGTFSTGNSGTGDRPASSPYAAAGTHSYGITNGSVTITSSNIDTSGFTSNQLSFRLASWSIASTGNGADGSDLVTVELSPDGGTSYFSTVRVAGNANAYWAYSATGNASTAYDGNATPVDFAPAGGASRTTDGYSTVTVTNLPAVANLKIRITLLNNATAERWTVDNLLLTGTAVGGNPDLSITQNAPSSVQNGATLTYSLAVTNNGTAISSPFDATFLLPASGYTSPLVTSSGCFTGSSIVGTTVTFTGCPALGLGVTTNMTVTVVPNVDGTLTSGVATVDSGGAITESNESNNTAAGVSTTVFSPTPLVINEVYTAGGNSGATYNADYVELYNNSASPISLNGYSLQYASAAGTFTNKIILPNASVPANGYFLIKTSPTGANGVALTPNLDATALAMSATAGNVILVNVTTDVGACPAANDATVIDRVGYGNTAVCKEGATTAPAPTTTQSISRSPLGSDTNVNGTDFVVGTPSPTAGTLATPSLSIADASKAEGNSGTSNLTFTVSLSSAAPIGGVTFDVATADNTATTADSDYVAKTTTGVTIAAGLSAATFDVVINGDTTIEPDETFFVNVTNVTGATVADAQGQGTITNDDLDTTSPTVSYTPISSGTTSSAKTVTVTATDNVGVANVQIRYTVNGSVFTIAPCSGLTSGTAQNGTYDCTIPDPAISPAVITYVVDATDAANNTGSNPAGSSWNLYTFGAATVPAGTYTNVSMSGASSIGGAVTVLGNLELGGIVTTGANVLTLDCLATTSGQGTNNYVNGNLQKSFCATSGTPFTYPVGDGGYAPVDVTVTTLTTNPSSLLVKAVNSRLANFDVTKSLSRHWELTETGDLTATLSFTYLAGEAPGNEADYRVFKTDGGPATNMCPSAPCVNTTTHVLGPVAGVSIFSSWTGAEPLAPTAGEVSLSGRVLTANGQGLKNAVITVSGNGTVSRLHVLTGPFGYYQFDGLDAGETYVVTVNSKSYTFAQPSRIVTLNDSLGSIDFTANPQ